MQADVLAHVDRENSVRQLIKYRWDTDPIRHYSPNPDEPLLFYGGPFSNFVGPHMFIDHPWTGNPARYETVEHWFQASKASSMEQHEQVRNAFSPGKAKEIGQTVDMWPNWDDVKYGVMLAGLRHKFREIRWAKVLDSTGNRYIAEDSPTDAIWGIYNPDRDDFTGYNLLGIALMEVRDENRWADHG